jgi:hypothetical protein
MTTTATFQVRQDALATTRLVEAAAAPLAHGQVRVERNNAIIATMGAGIILGEVSFIRNSVASADVVADSDTLEVHVIARDKLHALLSYGDPARRDRASIRQDLAEGYVSPQSVARDYGIDDHPKEPS